MSLRNWYKEIDTSELPYWEVYVTHDSDRSTVEFWNCNIGILKLEGCVEFRSARLLSRGERYTGCLGYSNELNVPDSTAWHVDLRTNTWTRIDQDMVLWDEKCKEIIDE